MKPLPPPKGPFGGLRTPVPEKFAAVYINDKFYGHAGEFNNSTQALMLPVGDYDGPGGTTRAARPSVKRSKSRPGRQSWFTNSLEEIFHATL